MGPGPMDAMDQVAGQPNGMHTPPSYTPGTGSEEPPPKRRRGRPPKKEQPQAVSGEQTPPKRRGRPPGTKNKTGSGTFTQIMTVNSEEDVVEKLKSFAVSHKRSLCILAACGSLSTATLMQVGPGGQGVGVTLTGQFTVLSISGAILHEISDGAMGEPKTFLSASLANPTGGVVGGTVAGVLEANGIVTLVICHWDPLKTSATQSPPMTPVIMQPSSGMASMLPPPNMNAVDVSVTPAQSASAGTNPAPPKLPQQMVTPSDAAVSAALPASVPLVSESVKSEAALPATSTAPVTAPGNVDSEEMEGVAQEVGEAVAAEGAD